MKQATFQISEKTEQKISQEKVNTEKVNTEKNTKNRVLMPPTTPIKPHIKTPIKKVENIYYL
jgi:hypothetical protein